MKIDLGMRAVATADFNSSARRRGLSRGQGVFLALALTAVVGGLATDPSLTGLTLFSIAQAAFVMGALWRGLLLATPVERHRDLPQPLHWPRYTIVAALHREAAVLPQLIERLSEIDYPHDRLEGFLALEAHDEETIAVAQSLEKPDWLRILIVPPGEPLTKPRALNHALAQARGEFLTVYDAEDDPAPLQLREAAARFAGGPANLACLQAPLRIRRKARSRSGFLDRQFAAEYAALFEVVLPAMARLGLPFPLGGTSNHFRVSTLRALGGWDAWNVTEDADLGFRLWRTGHRLGVLSRPTYETPPDGLECWLPQRTRWIKGYMQTLGVHTRSIRGMGWRGWLGLTMTLGMGTAAAAVHALSIAWLTAMVMVALAAGLSPQTPWIAIHVLMAGVLSAWIITALGARRASLTYGLRDIVSAPAYWSLLTLAFCHAAWRLVAAPFAWDKTPHRPDHEEVVEEPGDVDAGRQAA